MFSAKKRGKCALSAAFETDQKNFKTVKKKYLTPSIISCMITKVIAMEKILEQTLLYDFYGELLTEHQRQVYEDFVFNDLSLGEIASEEGISRQGVADLIKRCNKKLLDYEAKLHLVEKFMSIKSDIRRIHELTNDFKKSHNELLMNEIEAISNQILEEL